MTARQPLNSMWDILHLDLRPLLMAEIPLPGMKRSRRTMRKVNLGRNRASAAKYTPTVNHARGGDTLEGALKPGATTTYSLNGRDFKITDSTFVVGIPTFGAQAKLRYREESTGELVATNLTVG